MDWQATDQFGNLYVGESDAESLEELLPHLRSLVSEASERAGDTFQVTVDFDYREVSAPNPEQVSHVLRIPWMANHERHSVVPLLAEALRNVCAEQGLDDVTVAVT